MRTKISKVTSVFSLALSGETIPFCASLRVQPVYRDASTRNERDFAHLEHVDFFRNRDSQISLSVIQDPCWGREASMDDATLS
jgi:hypothetical protein